VALVLLHVPEIPERVICADPEAWYTDDRTAESMGRENYEDFRAAIHNPATVHAMLEDYRAGISVDRLHDDEDRRHGRRLQCPTLVVFAGEEEDAALFPDIDEIWRGLSHDVRLRRLASGHHMAEEAPEALVEVLRTFLEEDTRRSPV
jgi:haloacetate dehalogenase